jgi:hypothetical protein
MVMAVMAAVLLDTLRGQQLLGAKGFPILLLDVLELTANNDSMGSSDVAPHDGQQGTDAGFRGRRGRRLGRRRRRLMDQGTHSSTR